MTLLGIEAVEALQDLPSEVLDALSKAVVSGQLVSLGYQADVLTADLLSTELDLLARRCSSGSSSRPAW